MSNEKETDTFGRDGMHALIGGSLPERLVRNPATSGKSRNKNVGDMTSSEAAAWLQKQQEKGIKGKSVRLRTDKVRQYHELLEEQRAKHSRSQNATRTNTSIGSESSDDDFDAQPKKRTVAAPKVIIRKKRPNERQDTDSDGSSCDDDDQGRSPVHVNIVDQDSSSDDSSVDERRRQRLLKSRQAAKLAAPVIKPPDDEPPRKQILSPPQKTHDEGKQNASAGSPTVSVQAAVNSEDSESSDSSSEEESSSDDEVPVVSRPVFIPRHKRSTHTGTKAVPSINADSGDLSKQKEMESRALVQQVVASDALNVEETREDTTFTGAQNKMPDDDDETTRLDEWEIRELVRLLRDVDQQAMIQQEAIERERRMRMTDEECHAEDRQRGEFSEPGVRKDPETETTYLQRYYHKGAFYMDDNEWEEADIRHKASSYAAAATGEDKIDRKTLPAVMQVKRFGRANQTRYKGLAAEDTTDKHLKILPLRKHSR